MTKYVDSFLTHCMRFLGDISWFVHYNLECLDTTKYDESTKAEEQVVNVGYTGLGLREMVGGHTGC